MYAGKKKEQLPVILQKCQNYCYQEQNLRYADILLTTKNTIVCPVLSGKKIAIITENGFEEVELTSPKKALEEAGAQVHVVSPQKNTVKAWDKDHWSIDVPVDITLSDANPEDYDGLLIPGGVLNPDTMRINPDCIKFARHFMDAGKPVAAICHGPQLLIETGTVKGREMTSYPP